MNEEDLELSSQLQGEVDWFIFENRIRKIISEVISPMSIKITLFEEYHEFVKTTLAAHDKSFDDLKSLIFQNNIKLNLLGEVQNRLGLVEHSMFINDHNVE